MPCNSIQKHHLPNIRDEIKKRIREIVFDPHALFHRIDTHDKNHTNESDPNVPNVDVALRRKTDRNCKLLVSLFHFLEDHLPHMEVSSRNISLLEFISDLYMYQIEPELIELRLKHESTTPVCIERFERRHIAQFINHNHEDYRYIFDIPFNPTYKFHEDTYRRFYYYLHCRYDKERNPKHQAMYNSDHPHRSRHYQYEVQRIYAKHALLTTLIFCHSEISYIFSSEISPFLARMKIKLREVKSTIYQCLPILPDCILDTIINDYL